MGSRRKIIIIGSAWPLRGGGIATFNERLAKAYSDKGDDVIIYSFSLQYPSFLFPGTSQFTSEPAPPNINIKTRINSINPFNWIKVAAEIQKEKPDMVIVRFWIPFMGPSLGTISGIIKKSGIRVIAIVDNIIPHEHSIIDRPFSKYFVNRVDGFVTMSKSVLNDLNLFDKSKPKRLTAHPLYDNFGKIIPKVEALKSLGLSPQFNYILFFGFIREYKGLDLLLKAFADNRLRYYNLKLIVAGEFYVDKKPYLDLIEELGLKDYVILHNEFIPNDQVRNYFCASNVVAQPYKTATQSGITQVAYHFEKPVITTNVGGLAEIIIDNRDGFVVEPDEKNIADALIRFFDEKKEDEFVRFVSEDKKRFSWENLLSVIDEV
jgi:glycosyltransferase involved in cell wall biosynthesis